MVRKVTTGPTRGERMAEGLRGPRGRRDDDRRDAGAAEAGPLYINPIIYGEASVRFSRIEDLEDALPAEQFRRSPLPWTAVFLAGKAFLAHRQNRGAASAVLPDFFIGAHAAVEGLTLLTCDANRYRKYFPTVELRAP